MPKHGDIQQSEGPKGKEAIRKDAAGQYRPGHADPNRGGLHSANPVALSKDGDATTGNGHGRDRDPKGDRAG